MKKLTPLLSTLLLALGMSVPAMAQNMGSFENFLNSHPNTARELQQMLPNSQLLVVPGAGHLAFEERPEVCNKAMREWLAA